MVQFKIVCDYTALGDMQAAGKFVLDVFTALWYLQQSTCSNEQMCNNIKSTCFIIKKKQNVVAGDINSGFVLQ